MFSGTTKIPIFACIKKQKLCAFQVSKIMFVPKTSYVFQPNKEGEKSNASIGLNFVRSKTRPISIFNV